MNAFQIMEEIINELNDSTIDSMVRKRLQRVEDFDKKFKNSSNPLQLIDKKYQLENELNRAVTARDMRKANPEFKEFLKNRLAQYRENAKAFKEASDKKSNSEMTGEALEIMEDILNIVEGRKEESIEDYKNRLHKELVIDADKKAEAALNKGDFKEYSKQHARLDKLDDIQPVYNAYVRAEKDPKEDTTKEEMQQYKSVRRNAEKSAKTHGYNAKKLENRSIKAEDEGKERKAEYLYDKANSEWDKETAEQDRAAKAHKKVEELKYGGVKEALEIMEAILDVVTPIFELDYENKQNVNTNKIRKIKKDKDGENVEVVSVADELFPYEGNAKQQFNQKVLAKINDMIEGQGSLEDLIQFVRKYSGNRKGGNEKLHEALEILEKYTQEQKKGIAKKVLPERKREYLSKYADVLDAADEVGSENVPDGNLKDLERAEKRYKDAEKIANEALEEILQITENIFGYKDGRGDLLDDIDTTLGSPVKKAFKSASNKVVKNMIGCKQKKIHEALDLMEEIINEMKPATYGTAMGERANRLMADINKNDELEQNYYKAKESGNTKEVEKAADEWNKHDSYMNHDRSSNQNKLGRDIARINLIADDNKWSPEQRAEFNQAYNKAKTATRKNGKNYKFYTKW